MPKVKAIGTPIDHADRDDHHEEQHEAAGAHRHQHRLRQPQAAGDRANDQRAPR